MPAAPPRRPFPAPWRLDLVAPPGGLAIFLRGTDPQGRVALGALPSARTGPNRLVRAKVNLPDGSIRLFAVRRREPTAQPLLREVPSELPRSRWRLQE